MAHKSAFVVLILTCQHICCVMAAECTTAILASVFGTIGALLLIAAIVALIWYCCRRRQSSKKIFTAGVLTSKILFKSCVTFHRGNLKGAVHITGTFYFQRRSPRHLQPTPQATQNFLLAPRRRALILDWMAMELLSLFHTTTAKKHRQLVRNWKIQAKHRTTHLNIPTILSNSCFEHAFLLHEFYYCFLTTPVTTKDVRL